MAAATSIDIDGLDLVLRGVDAFGKAAEEELTKAIRSALSRVGRQLAVYPPPLNYRRTGNLGRGWTNAQPQISASGAGVRGELTNVVSYADRVQGDRQAPIHVGRWRTAQQVLDSMEAEIDDTIEAAIDTALRRVGLQGR
jgi:hypothetical protein